MLQRAKQNEGASLSHEFVQGLLGTLESEWSRVAVRGLLSSFLSAICFQKCSHATYTLHRSVHPISKWGKQLVTK